ncbi:MAG TPA: cytochrome P460 family protein [Bryobacteraceae bacterium]|jgi:hypothetical protein
MWNQLRVVITGALFLCGMAADEVAMYPKDFRDWANIKSAIITKAHPAFASEGGIHHIYANPVAVAGYASGKFADGSVIVYELVETNEKDAVITEGARRRVDVMVKDSNRYAATGGWGFLRFMGSNQTDEQVGQGGKTKCFGCHARAEAHGFVFSTRR